jgi:thiosulfate/3-mercaptopyruvate sulfurtransferase
VAVEPLVSTQWLGEHLDDDDLVVVDATVEFDRGAFHSGRQSWEESHIPGSVFAELLTDLSDPDAPVPLMAPSAERFAAAAGRLGISNRTRVVVYDSRGSMWAARVWWMLRAFGHDECAVLDGGMTSWVLEQRPVSSEVTPVEPATFVPDPRPGRFVAKEDVLQAIDDGDTQLVDALTEEQYRGEVANYGRAGHIPGAVNVPASGIIDRETQRYLSNDDLRERFEPALRSDSVITYCGGGVAASSDALALTLLGHDNVAVYDGSMLEWASDPELPLQT